ncbi:MAG: hypothetical protein KAJ86_05875 [Alphaproteobacteria bacterium]|nr:hypothetical protein [Alphaproteobacteria bacterium]
MIYKNFLILACIAVTISLTACCGDKTKDGQYWQRISVSESIHIRGIKAEQMLNRNIAHCVTELKELERLGILRNSIPISSGGKLLDPDSKKLKNWDAPEYDRTLLTEHKDFHDFESCMLSHGWERVEHLSYDVSK